MHCSTVLSTQPIQNKNRYTPENRLRGPKNNLTSLPATYPAYSTSSYPHIRNREASRAAVVVASTAAAQYYDFVLPFVRLHLSSSVAFKYLSQVVPLKSYSIEWRKENRWITHAFIALLLIPVSHVRCVLYEGSTHETNVCHTHRVKYITREVTNLFRYFWMFWQRNGIFNTLAFWNLWFKMNEWPEKNTCPRILFFRWLVVRSKFRIRLTFLMIWHLFHTLLFLEDDSHEVKQETLVSTTVWYCNCYVFSTVSYSSDESQLIRPYSMVWSSISLLLLSKKLCYNYYSNFCVCVWT